MQLFLAFVVALAITAALIPLLARWGPLVGLNDRPGPRKVHAVPVPRVGGIAMAAGILIPVLFTLELTSPVKGILSGLLILLAFGVWDDRRELGYKPKLAGQVIAVLLCISIGDVRIETITIDSRSELPTLLSYGLTFVFLIGVTNAVNLSDGLDGLAGGMSLLCLLAIALFAASGGNTLVTSLALIEAGAILGFLRFNTHPARVFMGDGGSQVLGFTIGAFSILSTQGETSAVSAALPLLLIGVPILDTVTVMAQRIRGGRSPFTSDRNHLHHKLLGLGFAHGQAVVLLYAMQVVLFLCAWFLRFESDVIIAATFLAFGALLLGPLQLAARSAWRVDKSVGYGADMSAAQEVSPPRSTRLPKLALSVMTTGLIGYTGTVIFVSPNVGSDVATLCVILLIAMLVLSLAPASTQGKWFDRTVAYVSVMLVVYLDQTTHGKPLFMSSLSWTLLAVTGAAALTRFLLSAGRRFQVTSLDLLVVFVALVVPNLPGSVALPDDLVAGIAKAVVLLYVVEMLLALDLQRAIPRACLVLTLGVIALRGLLVPAL